MSNKYFILSDIHGNYEQLTKTIQNIPSKQLVFLGDYIDGFFLEPNDTIDTLKTIKQHTQNGAIALLGNHDIYLLNLLDNPTQKDLEHIRHWIHFMGGEKTLLNLLGKSANAQLYDYFLTDDRLHKIKNTLLNQKDIQKIVEWFKTLPLDQHRQLHPNLSLVHAGYELGNPFNMQTNDTKLWIRERFFNRKRGIHQDYHNTLIIAGHTPTQTIHGDPSGMPYYHHIKTSNTGILIIDGGCNGTIKTKRNVLNLVELTIHDNRFDIACDAFNQSFTFHLK